MGEADGAVLDDGVEDGYLVTVGAVDGNVDEEGGTVAVGLSVGIRLMVGRMLGDGDGNSDGKELGGSEGVGRPGRLFGSALSLVAFGKKFQDAVRLLSVSRKVLLHHCVWTW